MFDAIKPLLESGIINEETSQAINEAWEFKLNEAREQVRAELREEFAQRYEHDKEAMVEALDKMISESLTTEIAEFQEEKRTMNVDRVKAQQKLHENVTKFNNFMVTKLSEEIKEIRTDRKIQFENQNKVEQFIVNTLTREVKELHNDRKIQLESQNKLEQFIVHALAREIKEFSTDKQAVVEARVKLVAEGRQQLEALKTRFVTESGKRLNATVAKHLKGEIGQLKEDIKSARENDFGRRIFESFASEFSSTHLNEKADTRRLMQKLVEKDVKLNESIKTINNAKKLIENKEKEVRIIKESVERKTTMDQLLKPLNEEKKVIMRDLLESVQTDRLQISFNKYLPAVLTNSNTDRTSKTILSEGMKAVTGDKATKLVEMEPRDNVIDIRRLAGL